MLLKLENKQNNGYDGPKGDHDEKADDEDEKTEENIKDDKMEYNGMEEKDKTAQRRRSGARGYASACLELTDVMIKGALGVRGEPDKTAAHSLSVAVDASLYVFQSHAVSRTSGTDEDIDKGMNKGKVKGEGKGKGESVGEEGFEFLTSDLCASFPIRINVSQGGSDPSAVVSSIALTDFASILSVTPTAQAVQLLNEFESHRKEAMSIITGFLASLEDEIPSLPSFQTQTDDIPPSSDCNASANEIHHSELEENATSCTQIPSTANPLNTYRPRTLDSKQEENCLSTYISSYGSPASSQHMITCQIKKNLLSSHQSLEHLHNSSILPSHSVITAIEEAILVCHRLQETTVKLRHAVLVTAGMTPSYCGWVYRSPSYLVNPPRVNGRKRTVQGKESSSSCGWGVRSWAVLTRNTLIFMPQPYAAFADFSIDLDDIVVNDPDDSEATGSLDKVVSSGFMPFVLLIFTFVFVFSISILVFVLYSYFVETRVGLDFYTSFAPDHPIHEVINCRTQDFIFFYASFSCHFSARNQTYIHTIIYISNFRWF